MLGIGCSYGKIRWPGAVEFKAEGTTTFPASDIFINLHASTIRMRVHAIRSCDSRTQRVSSIENSLGCCFLFSKGPCVSNFYVWHHGISSRTGRTFLTGIFGCQRLRRYDVYGFYYRQGGCKNGRIWVEFKLVIWTYTSISALYFRRSHWYWFCYILPEDGE